MKKQLLHTLVIAAALGTPLHAAVITLGDPVPNVTEPVVDGGVPYRWTAQLGGNDSGTASRHVGAWSWEDDALFNAANGEPPVGWTHTSDWVALSLTEAATLTFRLEAQAGVSAPTAGNPENIAGTASMFPSFTIYAGWDGDGSDFHSYNNRGNIDWAEDLTYLSHVDNSTQSFAERSWVLPAGNYSIVMGSNAAATEPARQGYLATFTTTAVPEASSSTLLLFFGLGVLGIRKRK